jgi:hypothetical protein
LASVRSFSFEQDTRDIFWKYTIWNNIKETTSSNGMENARRLRGLVLLLRYSVRITERHYNPWNKARQDQLEADLTRAWEQDPLVLAHAGDAPLERPKVHSGYTEKVVAISDSVSRRKTGARGGSRTHMRKNPRRILSALTVLVSDCIYCYYFR